MKITTSLRSRALRAGAWAGGGHISGQLLRLVGNLFLTRLLLPEAFGLMATIAALTLTLNLIFDVGSGPVIVQSKRGSDPAFLNTAWTLQIIRGLVIWSISILVALLIAYGQTHGMFKEGSVYDDERLPWLMVATIFSMVLLGFGSVNNKVAERNLDLGKTTAIDLGAQLFSTAAMIAVAAATHSIWALVMGNLLSAGLRCAMSHIYLPGPPPRLRLERNALHELISKGKWVMVSSVLGLIALTGDRLLLSGLFDGTTMGLYSIAFGLASMATSAVGSVFGRIMLPSFSEVVRERPAELPETYRKFQQLTDLVIGLVGSFMFMAAPAIIGVLYDDRYQGAAQIFSMLAVGAIGSRFLVAEQIYVAMGRTALLPASIFPKVLLLLIGLPLGYSIDGLQGALVAIVASSFVQWPIALWFRHQHGLNHWRNDIVLPFAVAAGLSLGWAANALWLVVST
ncbi:oligosaccharide flippase family protein [Piscinibacter gummiphilus]|uniref:Oligosaccharide flippase family protein n=1 Tax=Piscinibacter gummiphilus TaxID=946333 RepID=A0ABZ0CQP2_9BURK|nr:oligosaccharide flippase family protein [Piscinibacter gummiphilus]WOB07310.1 oligosaccharide flippase family protein [Piscinibacter gummiphilus]